jgi:hypothetical protein
VFLTKKHPNRVIDNGGVRIPVPIHRISDANMDCLREALSMID